MATSFNIVAISKLLKLTERRVQQLAKDGIIPKAERGKYDLVGSVHGYVDFLKAVGVSYGGTTEVVVASSFLPVIFWAYLMRLVIFFFMSSPPL